MSSYAADAIVLHRSAIGDNDRLIRLFTREHGKVGVVARGVRRAGSKRTGATEIFTHARVLLAPGRNLDVLQQVEVIESFPILRGALDLLARATYLCELWDRFLDEREPADAAFDVLLSALRGLMQTGIQADSAVHAAELRLMAERGYAPELRVCVRCTGLVSGGAFSPALGGVLCRSCRYAARDTSPLCDEAITAMYAWLMGGPERAGEITVSGPAMHEIDRCMRWYVRRHAERDLRSAEFLELLRSATGCA